MEAIVFAIVTLVPQPTHAFTCSPLLTYNSERMERDREKRSIVKELPFVSYFCYITVLWIW